MKWSQAFMNFLILPPGIRDNLNKNINPCEDFHQFVCGRSDLTETNEEDVTSLEAILSEIDPSDSKLVRTMKEVYEHRLNI